MWGKISKNGTVTVEVQKSKAQSPFFLERMKVSILGWTMWLHTVSASEAVLSFDETVACPGTVTRVSCTGLVI